jgi:hypothetical protein
VDGLTDWPDDVVEEGVRRAERTTREIGAPLLRAECLETIAAVFLF